MNFNPLRKDFPILQKDIHYLDNACMSLKPQQVLEAMHDYYTNYPACAGRSNHDLARTTEEHIEKTREGIKRFINASASKEIVFTRNTTEGINIVANRFIFKGNVLITDKEHNSNLLPWQQQKRVVIHPTTATNEFDLETFEKHLTNIGLVSMGHTSNLDGTTLPAKEIITIAHDHDIPVLLDCAQSIPHQPIDVKKLDVDFIAFSGHKMLGPTGTGILYGKEEHLTKMQPFLIGGETVKNTTYTEATWEDIPHKFEAGLQDYAGIIGLGAATRYLKTLLPNIHDYTIQLNHQLSKTITELGGTILGPQAPEQRGSIVNFTLPGIGHHDLALFLNQQKIYVRSGMHCVHSWYHHHQLPGSTRISFYFYNNQEDIAACIEALQTISKLH